MPISPKLWPTSTAPPPAPSRPAASSSSDYTCHTRPPRPRSDTPKNLGKLKRAPPLHLVCLPWWGMLQQGPLPEGRLNMGETRRRKQEDRKSTRLNSSHL